MTFQLTLLGPFTLTHDGAPVELKNKKAQALLAFFALTDKPHTREYLATLLWGDKFDENVLIGVGVKVMKGE